MGALLRLDTFIIKHGLTGEAGGCGVAPLIHQLDVPPRRALLISNCASEVEIDFAVVNFGKKHQGNAPNEASPKVSVTPRPDYPLASFFFFMLERQAGNLEHLSVTMTFLLQSVRIVVGHITTMDALQRSSFVRSR